MEPVKAGHRFPQPARVDGELIDLIRSREQGFHAQPLFLAGENVTVADGPFAGLEIYQTQMQKTAR